MSKKYTGSFAKVNVGKASTGGFKEKTFKTIKEFAKQALKEAWIPVTVRTGWRNYDNVTEIHNWLRFDCDVDGEKETICSVLKSRGITYIALPSTNYNPKSKNYKWHISVPTKKVAQDVAQYKQQVKQALIDLGIDLHDRRVTEVCVQNFNPYRNGDKLEEGMQFVEYFAGEHYVLPKRDKSIEYNSMSKTIFNGKGSRDVINKKVVRATESGFELLDKNSGIKIEDVGWVTLGSLNLEVGGIIGGLSCPAHNIRHNNGKGAHQTGYAFATMNEGGDVWISCTGAECQGKSYLMEQEDFGADTKLSDLFELRRLVSLSGFDFKSNSVMYINEQDIPTYFRFKDLKKHWGESFFWKIDMSLSEDAQKKIDKIIAKNVKEHEKSFDINYKNLSKKDEQQTYDLLIQSGVTEDTLNKKMKLYGSYKKVSVVMSVESLAGLETQDIVDNDVWGKVKEAMSNDYKYNKFYEKYSKHEKGYMGYVDDVLDNIINHLQIKRQFNDIEYRTDPYIAHTIGEVREGNMIITLNKLNDKPNVSSPIQKYVDDYKTHNPYLDDMIDMIMSQQFGADKKKSYLWLQCSSDWGKSFLFDGVFSGLSYEVSSDEIKNAIKGAPSGLDVNALVKCSCIFIDEFKGAVSEIKNITHTMTVTPKNRGKYTVPIGMKVFASAERVASLMGEGGLMEEQFRNRFLYINAEGSLLKRRMYAENKSEYFKAIKAYVQKRVYKIAQQFSAWGDVVGTKNADNIYDELITTYSIKNDSVKLDDILPNMFQEWLSSVANSEGVSEKLVHTWYKGCVIFDNKKREVVINNKALAVQHFINESVSQKMKGMVSHKDSTVIIGEGEMSSIKIDKLPKRGLKVNY